MTEMIERVAKAIRETADTPYHIQLVRLVDGVSTYELCYDGGRSEYYPSHSEALEEVISRRSRAQAKAVIDAALTESNDADL